MSTNSFRALVFISFYSKVMKNAEQDEGNERWQRGLGSADWDQILFINLKKKSKAMKLACE